MVMKIAYRSTIKLRFKDSQISELAERYEYPRAETQLLELRDTVSQVGFLTKDQLRLVGKWKAPRSAGHIEKNADDYVQEVTFIAFNAITERARIETLTILDGVSWPTASVILHLYHTNRYPILDFRALWSAGMNVPKRYNFSFWWPYVEFCRNAARRNNVDMRTLDRAMWQYSKENQKRTKT
jgi:hypothetical protein